jgi:NSS family neurotransmitter:Na+ symporter
VTQRESWGSRLGFILATAGYAVGLGNIWRFPYVVGQNGGGAFLLLYLVFAVLIGVPLLTTELSLGRKAQASPIAGMERLTGTRWSIWNLIGWLGVVTILLITSYYLMLLAWIVGYAGIIGSGRHLGSTQAETAMVFGEFTARPGPLILLSFAVVATMTLVVRRGLQAGLERLAKIAMPAFVVMLLGLALWSLSLPGAGRGVAWYLTPDFSAIDGRVALAALGQAFYSIGIGMAAAFGFGSYLPPGSSDIPGSVVAVVTVDTVMAFLAGLVIFPALFAFGMQPDSGPSLLFVTMTAMFDQMPGGRLFGLAFFALLIVAGFTSLIAAFEVLTSTLKDSLGLTRKGAATTLAVAASLLSVPVILSQGPQSSLRIGGRDLFTFVDGLSGNYLLTWGALLMALYVSLVWGFDRFRTETNEGTGRLRVPAWWRPLVRWVIPAAVGAVLLVGLGVL